MPSTANTVAPMSSATITAISPTAPRPTTHTRSCGLRLPAYDSVVGGGQVVGEKDRRLVRDGVGKRREHGIGVRNADELGLGAVETGVDAGVAEERSARALGNAAGTARGARPVGDEAHVHDAIAGSDVRHVRADLDDLACKLVPHDRPVLEAGDMTVERSEIGAADGRGVHSDDRVRRREEHGIRDVLDPDVVRAAEDDGLHDGCSISTR